MARTMFDLPVTASLEEDRQARVLSIAMHAVLIAIAASPAIDEAETARKLLGGGSANDSPAAKAFIALGARMAELYPTGGDALDDVLLCADDLGLPLAPWLLPPTEVIQ